MVQLYGCVFNSIILKGFSNTLFTIFAFMEKKTAEIYTPTVQYNTVERQQKLQFEKKPD